MHKKDKINFNLLSPDEIIVKITSVNPVIKAALFSSIVFFIIVHAWFFSQRLVNEDCRHMLYGWGTISNLPLGRIFGNILIKDLNPWTLGCISAVYMSLTSVLIVSLFNIKTRVGAIISSALMIGFPGLCYMYSYLYSAHILSRIIFLSVLAVWVTNKYKYGFIPGAIAFFISVGSGQYGLSVCMVVCVITLFQNLLSTNKVDKEFIIKAYKFIFMGVIGLALYFVLLKILLHIKNVELAAYKGMNDMGSLSVINIKNILSAYEIFFQFYFGKNFFYVSNVQKVVYIVIILLCIIKFISSIKNKKTNIITRLIMVLLIIMLPICVNIFDIVAPQAGTYVVTIYQMVYCLVFLTAVFESDFTLLYEKINHWIMVILLVITVLCNYSITSAYYLRLNAINEYTMLFENRLFSRIEEFPGFSNTMPIAVLSDGSISYHGFNKNLFTSVINDAGTYLNYAGLRAYTSLKTVSLMENYLGVDLTAASDEQVEKIKETEIYKDMGTYPSIEGIKVINGILVVNLYDFRVDIKQAEDEDITLELKKMNNNLNADISSFSTAWYVYKDGVINAELGRWYENNTLYTFTTLKDGDYKFKCFFKKQNENIPVIIESTNITIKNGRIIED